MKVQSKEQLDNLSEQTSVFMKVEKGETVIRILSGLYAVKQHSLKIGDDFRFPACPTENARMRIAAGETQDTEVPPCPLCELGYPVQTQYLCTILERERKEFNKKGQEITVGGDAWVLKKGPALMGKIQAFLDDENWGSAGDYDIKIIAVGDQLARKYEVSPIPKEKCKPLSPAEEKAVADISLEVDLEKMTTPNSYEKVKEIIGDDFPEYTPPKKGGKL